MRRAYLMVVPILGAAAFACQLLVGIDDRKVAAIFQEGGTETGTGDPCQNVGFPPAPDPSTSGANDTGDFFFALYSVDTGTDAGAVVRPWGFNLDSQCSCPGPNSCATAKPFCDREGGLDDEGQYVFTQLQMIAQQFGGADAAAFFSDELFNNALQTGASGLLVRVREYNGKAEDARVQVAIYSSPGYQRDAGYPKWNGSDPWRVDNSYVMGSVDQPNYEVSGWVTDSTLVASPAQIPIVIGSSYGQPVRLRLDNGYIVAKIMGPGNAPTGLVGTLAGRWKALDFLQGLQTVPDPMMMSQYLCGASITYSFVQSTVCAHRDLNADKGFDNKNAACDAVSFGIGFEARRATPGVVEQGAPPVQGCGNTWKASCPN